MPSYQARRNYWRKQFSAVGLQTADLDARLLLLHVAQIDAAKLISIELDEIPSTLSDQYDEACARRLKGEPVARIIGHKEFYGHRFSINKDTLVPRPDTELLVEKALEKLPEGGRFLDLGTGSGAIVISLLLESRGTTAVATDLSQDALQCAAQNADQHGVASRLELLSGSWFEPIGDQKFDVIISNPPYIDRTELAEMNSEALLFDPELALFAEDDGLAAYKQITSKAGDHLKENGWLLFEIGHRQGDAVSSIMKAHGFSEVAVYEDLAGLPRVVVGQR